MRMTLGSIDFFPSNEPEDKELFYTVSRQLPDHLAAIIPVPWKKVVFYFETSMNGQELGLMFQTETGSVYLEEDLTDIFHVKEQDVEAWMDHMFEVCDQFYESGWNITGDVWSRLDIILLQEREPEFRFTEEDWCDVNSELKRALLKRQEFGVVEESDKKLLYAYDDFISRHLETGPASDIRVKREAYRDLSECFRPHHFDEKMVAEMVGWLRKYFCERGLSCTEAQIVCLAKELLYASEKNDDRMTEEDVRMLNLRAYIGALEELSSGRTEYYCLQDSEVH